MRKFILPLVFLLSFAAPVYGQEQSPEIYCTNLSTWVLSVTMKKINGVPEENVLEVLSNEEGSDNLPPELAGIIKAMYSPEMPELREGRDIAAVVALFAEQCMIEVKSRREND